MERKRSGGISHSVPGRLNSWKEIAAYLGTSERTVQRWERIEALPVHRHIHRKASSVYAYEVELEAWLGHRQPQDGLETGRRKPWRSLRPVNPQHWGWWVMTVLAVLVAWLAWR
jgi:transcriptional regulator with XRE-family HTH domain